jgi:hypothetical protein
MATSLAARYPGRSQCPEFKLRCWANRTLDRWRAGQDVPIDDVMRALVLTGDAK